MNSQDLHIKAISIADEGFLKKFSGQLDEAKLLFKEALRFEKEAALAAQKENIGEPSISVLLKSAASLAINCDEFREAEKLISIALYGEPPFEIAEELRNLLEELHFQRHLQLQGITLDPTELQLVIAGRGIGYGMVKSNEILDRINIFEKITFRTVERKAGRPFREKGNIAKEIKMNFQPYLSIPRAASFAFTIRLGGNSEQLKIPGFERSVEIIDDIIDNISLVNQADFESLKEKINDETYFKNFVGLSKELAPDGKEISLVGLTITRNGKEKKVQFTRRRNDIHSTVFIDENELKQSQDKRIELTGRLSAADQDKSNIRLTLDNGFKYSVTVPEGLGDIVKKYWGEQVKITGIEIRQRAVKLIDLDPA
ncbi:MAG: hypothetical protein KKG93_11055 [Bacteroidetes bacterium]|nr:hypothetical protein [Bacteroidota bacterium]